MSKGKEAGKIQVYVRVRPFTEREKEKREPNAIEIHQEHSLIRVLDPRSRTNYFFDGVFSPEATNHELYLKVGKPLVYAALNGYKGTLLTYGQTGTGKTFTLLSDDGITTRVVQHCFEKIDNDEIHTYKVMCSFLQVYQEKVYDLLNPRLMVDLPVREHPKKGVYVANLTQHEVKSAGDVFALLEVGKQHLVIAETKMVRHSSRSHSIMQLIIERRLKEHIANEKPPSESDTSASQETVQESIMAVDETINNLIKELKQERKSHHKRERECLKELMEKEVENDSLLNNGNNFEGDLILKGKINLCDLAGSERLTKTKAEGVRLTEAKYLNTSLLELGNVIYALARGHKRHVPYRNSTLTRLLQDCLGDNGKTNFIICIAPSLAEVNETKCSLNFGLRAMRITNVARLNVEVDYKVLAERLAKKLEDHDIKYKFEKLEYLREIQRLKSAITCYQESENFAGKDHEKLVSVIANLSKSVQREKEEKNNLQTKLVCLKKQVSQPMGSSPDVEAILLAELMSLDLLANLQTPDVAKSILSDTSLPAKVKSHLALFETQEALLSNAGCFLQLLDLHLVCNQDFMRRKDGAPGTKDHLQFTLPRPGVVEMSPKDSSRSVFQEPNLSLSMCNPESDETSTGLAGGVRKMLVKLIGRDSRERTSPDAQPSARSFSNGQGSLSGNDGRVTMPGRREIMVKTKALLKQLSNSKGNVEQQVLNLMSSLVEEQVNGSEESLAETLQWNELRKKLTRLIMFRRNNMPSLTDADLWANSENLNSVLENCLRFVIIDKTLLACLLVIELIDLRQACEIIEGRRHFPTDPNQSIAQEDTLNPNKSYNEKSGVKGDIEISTSTGNRKGAFAGQENGKKPKESISPRREKLRNLKHSKTELEKEISEVHEDTSKLETELFSTMEEKTKVEEELFGMKHHVTKLRSELFHLKLEKSNLENDVKRSQSQENLQQSIDGDDGKVVVESPKEVVRTYPELSDVMEVSHESNDSENSSQMSDGHESREAFLKTCMENISKIYPFMPHPGVEAASDDELTDDQEPTFSDANIDDSDEEIIITKLARSLRSPCTSPAKEKSSEATSPSKSGKKLNATSLGPRQKAIMANDNNEDLKSKSKEALMKQIQELKRKLHKTEQELAEAQESSEDLEEELDHKKGQLAEAQETITNLENQLVEEKENCEQVREEYFNVKTQRDILDEKIKALRSELERVLVRENNALSATLKTSQGYRSDNPPPSPTKITTKSSLKSPGKTKVGKIDLRNPPQTQFTSNEMEVVGLLEETAELKVKLDKATQEKARLEKSQKFQEEKSARMTAALRTSEDACSRLKNEFAILKKEKMKLEGEVVDIRNNNLKIVDELQKYKDKSSRLEKDIEAISYMSTRLEKDNKMLEMEISKMESDLSSCKSKHEVASKECKRLNQERVQVEKECEKALHELETLKIQNTQLLESEESEQKRLNCNLQKELAGMAEYQEALENEYSKVKSMEQSLRQELAKVSSRVVEVETELATVTQNSHTEGAIAIFREGSLSFGQESHNNTQKPELIKGKKTFNKTPSKKFYTITHTSEDEIGDTSSSIAESPADESKQLEHEYQLLKLENGYLQQQLSESEHVLTMYRQDLESAHDLIDKLQANEAKVLPIDQKNELPEEDCKTPSDKDDTIKEIKEYPDNANDEYKLLEEKHAELTREYEILRQQYQEALTDKEKEADGMARETTNLIQSVPAIDQTEKVVLSAKKDVSGLTERITELEADNGHLKIQAEELSRNEMAKIVLIRSLDDAKQEITQLKSENEELRAQSDVKILQQSTSGGLPNPLQLEPMKDVYRRVTSDDDEVIKRKLEEDLLKVTSEKLKLEFELASANKDCERLKNDLDHSESERNLLNSQLNDNIEKAANLEVRLVEMRCSCETIKEEINMLKNQKRQESFHLHEASVCKEILEKRLEDSLKENNFLRQELDTLHEERRESEKNSAKLEKEKDQLTIEIENVKTQIRKLELEFEESKAESETRQNEKNQDEKMTHGDSGMENFVGYSKRNKDDQEQSPCHREEVYITTDHSQMKNPLEEVKNVKESHENITITTTDSCGQCKAKEDEATVNYQTENKSQGERTTFDTLEIEKHTILLEKEKRLLEKELTRVQEECSKLKHKLEVIKYASENTQTQEERRKDLEERHEQLQKELQELRALNQRLETECDDSHKLIQELEVKTKALESLQKELHCFHKENERLTHEVEIIQNTSKAMTDHQRSRESLESENATLKEKLERLKDCNGKLQAEIEELGRELLTFKEQSRNISQDSSEKSNVSLQNQVEKLQKMQKHLESELASSREKIKELELANESLRKENKAVKGRIKSLEQRNEELRRKDDKKKTNNVENKPKAKIKGEPIALKDSKEATSVTSKTAEETAKNLQTKIELLENDKIQLEEKLNSLKEKSNGAVKPAPRATMATQTTELQSEDETVETLNTVTPSILKDHNKANAKPENESASTPLTIDMQTGYSLMAKEKLVLERKATHFARTQMQLEQAFAKAMKENAMLKAKVGEKENVLEILREKVHELEKKNSAHLSSVDLKQNVLISSDSESEFEQDKATDPSTKDRGKSENADSETSLHEALKSAKSNRECPSNPLQPDVEESRREKEKLVEMAKLKLQQESWENVPKQQEDLQLLVMEVEKLTTANNHSCLIKPSRIEVEQPQRASAPVDKETTTGLDRDVPQFILPSNHGCEPKSVQPDVADQIVTQKETKELVQENQCFKTDKDDVEDALAQKGHETLSEESTEEQQATFKGVCQLKTTQFEFGREQLVEHDDRKCLENLAQENELLKQERESLLEELEEANKQKNWTENELKHNKESCLKQEQEMKLLLSSYSQEKESLLKEVENTSTDCRKAKEKLRELQQIESDFDDIRRKSKEAEHLITELEKDLLSQTEMKNELKRELQTCQNQLQKMTDLEKQLHSCRAEIKDLQYRNEHLTEEVKRWKDANEAQYSSLQLVKAEKPKRNSASTNTSTQSFQSRCVQTITSFYKWENNVLEDKTVANASHGDNASHAENAKGIDNDKENSYQNKTEDVSNNTNAVESNSYGVQSISRSDIPEGNFDHPEKTAEMTLSNCTGPKMLEEAIYYQGLPIPIIIVSQFDDIGISRSEHTATFSLRIEDFECDSPNDQSTPDEENEKFEHSVDKERCREMKPEGPVGFINTLQDMNEKTFEINLPSETEFTIMENEYPGASYTTVVLEPGETSSLEAPSNLLLTDQQISDDAPSDALSSKPMEIEEISSNDREIPDTNTDTDISKTRRELEWNISSLKSELAQRAEEHEKNQLEIGALMDEKLCMKREISSLVSECESLRAKTAVLQTQNEAILKEQILNDEELEELQQNLRDLKQEKNEIEEAKKNLESQNARLEIELSDAMETKEAMERELFRVSSEDTDASKLRLETQLHDITERYTKLETVLSCVLDENSQMTAQLSALQSENNMLKSFKIMEITDNCTQFSPRTTEDESDGEGRQSEKRKEAETLTKPFTSKANLTLSLDEKLIQLPSTNSPPSPNGQGRAVSNVTPCQAEGKAGENTYQLPRSSNVSRQKKTELSIDHVGNSLDEEKSIKRDRGPLTAENSHQSLRSSHDARNGRTPPLLTDYERALTEKSLKHATPMINRLPQRKRLKNNSRKYASFDPMYDASEDVLTRDSDDNDSSMEVNNTSSSLVSATDLDMSISSDQISSEDSTNIGPEIRVLQKMQKELAETKCSNVLVKNELSIIKRHNSDLQSQVQKLLSRNNHLKTKMCERTLSVKRMEKEVSSIKDDNNRLQQEALAMQEEMSRLEKEKAKFERNMSSTKSENKRLKSDLSSIKAESYRTMKELVNLQSENRRLQLEIGKLREEIRSFKGVLSDESVSQELPLWGSLSNGDLRSVSRRGLQERPARQDSIYLQQRASTDIAFSQHKQHTERTQMPELLPLNLTAELNDQHSDGGSIGKALTSSADTISGNSSVGTRAPDPLSRLASPLSFTSEGSLPSEQNDRDENEHNREKVAQQDQDEDEGKGKNKKKIKTILRKLQNSKKTKSSK